MRRAILSLVAAGMVAMTIAGPVSANGPQPGRLGEHGWTCFNVPDLGVHCAPPGREWAPPVEMPTPLLYWGGTTDPMDTAADFSGTEMLLPHALYHGQPCPQEGLDEWKDIGIARACHRR
ncbi:MAG: hypothetical protein M3295_04680 [Chloroflexota bacterium]|nr:hypothetical protein [Chloroflexota bacterium]